MADVRFARLRDGSWGVRAEGTALSPGQTVRVAKKDGTEVVARVGRLLWSKDGVTLVTVTSVEEEGGGSGSGSGRRVCADCGRSGKLVQDMEDGLYKHYRCCDMPPGGG